LLLVYLGESSIHIECRSSGNVGGGKLFLESFLDFIKKDDGSFDLEGALSEADIEDVLILHEVVIIPA
jgi:hypothetical protein